MLRRPVGAVAHTQRDIFVVEGGVARRRSVGFGEASDRTVVIESGVAAGEVAIVSETTRWENVDTLELVE